MLPKSARLSRSEFASARRQGTRVVLPSLTLHLSPRRGRSKVGLITPKAGTRTSAARHALRRRFYEAVRPLLPRLQESLTLIIIPRPTIAKNRSLADIRRELEQGLQSHLRR